MAAEAAAAAVPPRAAASLVLLRDGGSGPEVFLIRRARSMRFAPRMHVFPGGAVDPPDADPALPWHGPDPGTFAAALTATPGEARALAVAAVRETFEECGVLVAGTPDAVATPDDGWEDDRLAVAASGEAFADVLRRRGIAVRADLLTPWAHWVTPPQESRRFDTRFFVAALPPGQEARFIPGEASEAAWRPVADAVAAAEELSLMPPTLACLQQVADAGADVAAVLASRPEIVRVAPEQIPPEVLARFRDDAR